MYKFLIGNKANVDSTYDKIFKIIEKHSTFFRVNTENEYRTPEGYLLEFKEIPVDAIDKICNLKHVEQI